MQELERDDTLKDIKCLADNKMRSYRWENQNIVHKKLNHPSDNSVRLVSLRQKFMRLAHKALGHLGAKKTLKELTRLFVWPGVTMDVKGHVNSCDK